MGLQICRHEHEDSSRLPMLRGLRVPRDGGVSRSPLAPDLRRTITSRLPSVALRAFPNSLNVVVWFPDLIGCGVVDLVS